MVSRAQRSKECRWIHAGLLFQFQRLLFRRHDLGANARFSRERLFQAYNGYHDAISQSISREYPLPSPNPGQNSVPCPMSTILIIPRLSLVRGTQALPRRPRFAGLIKSSNLASLQPAPAGCSSSSSSASCSELVAESSTTPAICISICRSSSMAASKSISSSNMRRAQPLHWSAGT